MREEIITTIPQPRSDGALEVAIIYDETAEPQVELRELVWGAGVGWYRQHTYKLDDRATHALLRTLGHLRSRLKTQRATRLAPAPKSGRKVIPFPRALPLAEAVSR